MPTIEFSPHKFGDGADIYSIKINNDKLSEFQKFIVMFRDSKKQPLLDDFNRIIKTVDKIASEGALERLFRPEGKQLDRVFAIPLLVEDRKNKKFLRLYCLRVSETLMILGGGGIKETETYQEDKYLYNCVKTLQKIDRKLVKLENDGIVLENEIINITIEI